MAVVVHAGEDTAGGCSIFVPLCSSVPLLLPPITFFWSEREGQTHCSQSDDYIASRAMEHRSKKKKREEGHRKGKKKSPFALGIGPKRDCVVQEYNKYSRVSRISGKGGRKIWKKLMKDILSACAPTACRFHLRYTILETSPSRRELGCVLCIFYT